MSILQGLYQFFIQPLILILEMIYGTAWSLMNSYGGAIIPLSLAVNCLLLPFYKRADAIQEEERRAQERMKAGLDHIKATFRGDEQALMQLTYYRLNGYKPLYSLRSLLPLALEVPFFIAAYQLLTHIEAFDGRSFGPFLADLGAPDQLLAIGSVRLNALPILMTIINIVSSEIYTKGAPLKEKLMLHGMALVFLLLLYNSPSALVFYWTLNNIFSLAKNIISKAKELERMRSIVFSLLGAAFIVYALMSGDFRSIRLLVFGAISILLQLPLLRTRSRSKQGSERANRQKTQGDAPVFFIACAFLTLLTGLLIPTATIVSSPAEFMLASNPVTPLVHVPPALLCAAGTLLLWLGLFYYLSSSAARGIFTACALILSGAGITDYLFFGNKFGNILPQLQYEHMPLFDAPIVRREMIVNYLTLMLLAVVLFRFWQKKRHWILRGLIAACLAVTGLSAYNAVHIQRAVPVAVSAFQQAEKREGEEVSFTLSTEGQNVIVVMIDAAAGAVLPYVFNERPDLIEQFDGFTWYPNTLSFSNVTNAASSAVFGGYDYRPDKMNERSDVLLVDKHNEALLTMPLLFSEAGYAVTVCDPPYANYNWVPDLSIFDAYPEINAFLTDSGQFTEPILDDADKQRIWKRNFFCFSFMRAAPLFMQPYFYQRGFYYDSALMGVEWYGAQTTNGISVATGYREDFLNAWYALCAYPQMTKVETSERNTFTMLYNSTAHNYCLLQEPTYEPALKIDNTEYDRVHADRFVLDGRELRIEDEGGMAAYQCLMAAMIRLGVWLDDMRAKDVYDNTRIILVADHGTARTSIEDLQFGEVKWANVMYYNPVLMVKDFGDRGFTVSDAFMTNADTPALALAGLIDDPANPFTGNSINNNGKMADGHLVFHTKEAMTTENNGTTFLPGDWMELTSDDIFDVESWKILSVHGQ